MALRRFWEANAAVPRVNHGYATLNLAYYNEINPYCVEWLNNQMDAGLITNGFVDDRPIQEVPDTFSKGFLRQHYFAGIAGWEYALQLAGWPEDVPVWTGSCPCQPFSVSGKREGSKDKRHLWPDWYLLIALHKPPVIFGEQVASKMGREWLGRVRTDLEALGYAVGAADLCAAGAGEKTEGWVSYRGTHTRTERLILGAPHIRQRLWWVAARGLADSDRERLQRRGLRRDEAGQGRECHAGPDVSDFWNDYVTRACADGKQRRAEPGILPVAHGVSRRMEQVQAYGNAIVPPLAATFIRASMECLDGQNTS